ncbi:hypothetical protein ACIA5C_41610 [Actinoplanes sp. NPDC051343]|uniref:nSTAND1 domain-containing NTPase n=1 Tax=Actinoplanes sp. NPDC051343 TaxID=3363906 RepID=UPI0037913E42
MPADRRIDRSPDQRVIESVLRAREDRAIDVDIDPAGISSRDELRLALTTLRRSAGATIRDIARRADVPRATADDYLSARHLPGLTQTGQFRALLRACGVREQSDLDGWVTALQRVRADSDGRLARRRSRQPAPYRGLAAFEPADADVFFGRDSLVRRLVERVDEVRSGSGLLFLVGASGAGKSSVLRAGLLPALTAPARLLVPGADPAAELEKVLAETPGVRVLVVDQFEELYTLADPASAGRFLDHLTTLDRGTVVVAGLRADFFAPVAGEPRLVESLQAGPVVVPPPTDEELRAIIVGPAAGRGVAVEQALADILVADARSGQNVLPLLSHALLAAWEGRGGDRLTVGDYQAAGGLRGAVQQSAEAAYGGLAPAQRELARRMFLRLVNLDEGVVTTKRRIDRSELPGGDEPGDEARVIEAFVGHRLVTVDERHVEISHEALLIAWPRMAEWVAADHAGLLTHQRLTRAANDWTDHGNDSHRLFRGTQLAGTEEWAADPDHRAAMNRRERAFLAAAVAARAAEQRAARRRVRLLAGLACGLVAALVATAVSATRAVRDEHSAERARDDALSRQVAIESSRAIVADPALAEQLALAAYRISPTPDAGSALLDATAAGVVNRRAGTYGPTAMRLSPGGDVLAVSDARTGDVVLYRQAGGIVGDRLGVIAADAATDATDAAATATDAAATDQVFALAFAADGRTLAVGGTAGRVRLFDVSDPARARPLPAPAGSGGAVEALAFSADGSALVAGGAEPALRAWKRDGTGWRPAAVSGGDEVVQAVAFSPDGRTLVTGGTDGTLRRRPAATPGAPTPGAPTELALGTSTITTVAFAPGRSGLVVGAKDGTAELVGDHDRITRLDTGFTSWVNAAAYSADGKVLAIGGSNGTVALFDAATATRLDTVAGSSPITGLAWAANGQALLAATSDGTVRGFPMARRSITAGGGAIFSVGYDGSGRRLAFASNGASAGLIVRTAGTQARQSLPASFGKPEGTSAVSPDGTLLVTGNASGKVALVGAGVSTVLTGATQMIESLAFSPDGRVVAAASDDGHVHLWDVRDPAAPRSLPALDSGGLAASVAFSHDGKLLAAAGVDRRVHLWDVGDPAHARLLATPGGFDNYAWSVAFSHDSKTLAAGGADDTIRLWDVSDPSAPRALGPPLPGPTHYIFGLTFDPAGTRLAAAGGDGSVWIWRLTGGTATSATELHAADYGGSTYAVAYSPDGSTLAAAGSAGTVTLFDTDPRSAAAAVCRDGGDRLTRAEWARYVAASPFRDPCR